MKKENTIIKKKLKRALRRFKIRRWSTVIIITDAPVVSRMYEITNSLPYIIKVYSINAYNENVIGHFGFAITWSDSVKAENYGTSYSIDGFTNMVSNKSKNTTQLSDKQAKRYKLNRYNPYDPRRWQYRLTKNIGYMCSVSTIDLGFYAGHQEEIDKAWHNDK